MKKLLDKTLTTFSMYALVVLAASIPAYYYLVDSIWLRELDENNRIIADKTAHAINRLQLSDTTLSNVIRLWNAIQPGTNVQSFTGNVIPRDSIYTVLKQKPYVLAKSMDRFRGLVTIIQISGKPYLLTVETNVEETEETVLSIAVLTFVFFLVLVIGFLIINKRMSVKLWKPFRSSLAKLKAFNLHNHSHIHFEKSDTVEFEELNTALHTLIKRNIQVYKTQKEFTENASHELQTPLAILKSKLDLLLQQEKLTDSQYEIAEDIHQSITRISRINKNLLLLAKIENNQFENNEMLNISCLLYQCLQQCQEYADNKRMSVEAIIEPDVNKMGNASLTEILLFNLLLNAIRHTPEEGTMIIQLNQYHLSVANTGKLALNSQNLFQRFAKTQSGSAGAGLGLAIVFEVCNHSQWQISYSYQNDLHFFTVGF